METVSSFARRFWWAIILLVLIIVIGGGYASGYRVAPGGIARVGTLTLTDMPAGTKIFIDQSLSGTATSGQSFNEQLVPGNHTVIVNTANDFPWSSIVRIESGQVTKVDPLLVQMNVKEVALFGAEAKAGATAIATAKLPTVQSPLKMQGGCAVVYVHNNQVIEAAATSTPGCTPPAYLCMSGSCDPTIIFSPVTPLTNLFPYPGRQDAVLVGFDNGLYALSLDPTNPQFFAPIVRGTNPKFGQLSDGSIVVGVGTSILKLLLTTNS